MCGFVEGRRGDLTAEEADGRASRSLAFGNTRRFCQLSKGRGDCITPVATGAVQLGITDWLILSTLMIPELRRTTVPSMWYSNMGSSTNLGACPYMGDRAQVLAILLMRLCHSILLSAEEWLGVCYVATDFVGNIGGVTGVKPILQTSLQDTLAPLRALRGGGDRADGDGHLCGGGVVGVLGEGPNIEKQKRLTIAVELVAKPISGLEFAEGVANL
jgi:hypothetical protein